MTVVLWNRLPADLVVLEDRDSFKRERSKQDQLSRAIESNICFISFLLTNILTLSLFSHCHAFISHYIFYFYSHALSHEGDAVHKDSWLVGCVEA